MQKNKSSSGSRSRHVQSTQTKSISSRYAKDNTKETLILLGALSLLIPPLGALLTWRTNRMALPARAAFSALALASMTLIFCLFLRPGSTDGNIRPMPVVPDRVGYGVVSAGDQVSLPEPTYAVPAAPGAIAPAEVSVPEPEPEPTPTEETGLTMESTVYAVTNNASSYHLYEICELQTNNRALTLQQALNEGLKPCEKCVGAVG